LFEKRVVKLTEFVDGVGAAQRYGSSVYQPWKSVLEQDEHHVAECAWIPVFAGHTGLLKAGRPAATLAHLFGDPGEQRRLRCLVVAVVIF
jgi:hypothetical protein